MQIVLENSDGAGMVTAEYGASWAARPRVVLYQGRHYEQNRTDIEGRWVYRTSQGGGGDPAASDPLLSDVYAYPAPPPMLTPLQAVLDAFALALAVPGPVPHVLVEALRDAVQIGWPRG